MPEPQFLMADPQGVFYAEVVRNGLSQHDELHVRTIDRRGATDRLFDADQAAQLVDGLAGLVEQMKARAKS